MELQLIKNLLIKNPHAGQLITFEGIDGSGKSDQFNMIHDLLVVRQNVNVIFAKEPPNNPVGVEIYDIIRGHHETLKFEELSEIEMQKKYFRARRMQYQDVYLPAIRAGVHVISDRGLVSVAYGIQDLRELGSFLSVEKAMFEYEPRVPFIAPNLNLIFDVDVDTAIERLKKKHRKLDKFEQRAKLEQARTNYIAIADKIPNCVVIDGRPSKEKVFVETKRHIFDLLGLK